MERVSTSTAAASLPARQTPATPGYFTHGDPGAAVPATVPGPDWFNDVQESILAAQAAAGLTPVAGDTGQLAEAIKRLAGLNALYAAADLMLVAAQSGFVRIDASTGPVTVTLPSASVAGAGLRFVFLRWDGTANAVNLARTGGDSISGLVTFALTTQIHTVELVSDGIATWWVAADNNASRLGGLTAPQFVRADVNTDITGNPTLANDVYLRGKNPSGEVTRLIGAAGNGKVYMGAVDATPLAPVTEVITRVNGVDALAVTATTTAIGGVPLVKSTDVIPVAAGGTGATTAAAARGNLGVGLSLVAGPVNTMSPVPATGVPTVATVAHGLGVAPDVILAKLVCLIAELGYAIGDEVSLTSGLMDTSNTNGYANVLTISANVVYLTVAYNATSATQALQLARKDTGAAALITPSRWEIRATPYKFA